MTPRDFSARGARRPAVPTWILLSLPAAALVSVLLAAQSARSLREAAAADLQRVQREVEETRARALQLRRDPKLAAAGDDAAPGPVLAALSEAMPDDIRLEAVALDYDGGGLLLRMQLEAAGPSAWDQFVQQLASHPRFTGVLPGDETREGAVRAVVTASWKR